MIKTLKYNNEQYEAERIVKTDTNIIGYDFQNSEIFCFKGITDFTLFTLEEGQEFDISDEDKKNQRITDLELTIAEMMAL